jgi:hypothetical protein
MLETDVLDMEAITAIEILLAAEEEIQGSQAGSQNVHLILMIAREWCLVGNAEGEPRPGNREGRGAKTLRPHGPVLE